MLVYATRSKTRCEFPLAIVGGEAVANQRGGDGKRVGGRRQFLLLDREKAGGAFG